MKKVILPVIKKVFPTATLDEIIGSQPMTGESHSFKFRVVDGDEPPPKEGTKRHVFSRGWEVYYGNEWIPESVWMKIKISGMVGIIRIEQSVKCPPHSTFSITCMHLH